MSSLALARLIGRQRDGAVLDQLDEDATRRDHRIRAEVGIVDGTQCRLDALPHHCLNQNLRPEPEARSSYATPTAAASRRSSTTPPTSLLWAMPATAVLSTTG